MTSYENLFLFFFFFSEVQCKFEKFTNMTPYYSPILANTTPASELTIIFKNIISTTGSSINSKWSYPDTNADVFKYIARFIYGLILIIGIPGNILTCYIIISTKFMRRSIHFYTFNLAASDALVVLCYVPIEIVKNENDFRWTMGIEMCYAGYCLVPLSVISSIFTLVAITLDRHRAVTRPLMWRGDTTRITKMVIPLIWILAITLALPPLAFVTLDEEPVGSGDLYCADVWTDKIGHSAYSIVMFCVQVPIPLLIIIVCNINMLRVMTRNETSIHSLHNKRTMGMVLALVLIYAICTLPQQIIYFWGRYGKMPRNRWTEGFVRVSNLLIICQSAINPIIYGRIRKDLKRSFTKILNCCQCFGNQLESRPRLGTDANSSILTGTMSTESGPSDTVYRRTPLEQNDTDTPPLPRFVYQLVPLVFHNNGRNSNHNEKSLGTVKKRCNEESPSQHSAKMEMDRCHLKDKNDKLYFYEKLENDIKEVVKLLKESNETKL